MLQKSYITAMYMNELHRIQFKPEVDENFVMFALKKLVLGIDI